MLAHAKTYAIAPIQAHEDTLSQKGFVAHPTNFPWESIAYGRQEVAEFSGKASLWEAMAAILPYASLWEAMQDGFFEPAKAFADEPGAARYADWLEAAYRKPLAVLTRLPYSPRKDLLGKAIRRAIRERYGLGIIHTAEGLWDTYTNGLEAYEGPTLGEAIAKALQARPNAGYILAFIPARPLRFCKPCGFWLADFELGRGPIYLFDLRKA